MLTPKDLESINSLITGAITGVETRISNEIGNFIQDSLIPLIEEKADKSDIDRIERKMDRFFEKDQIQDRRLDALENIPVIAHALKR